MAQPATLTEQEVVGRWKKLAPTLAATCVTSCSSCWWCEVDDGILHITKLEVAVEVQGRRLCCCWSLGARIVAWIFTIITNHCNTIRPNGTVISLHHYLWICSTESTCNNSVPLLRYFALENKSNFFPYYLYLRWKIYLIFSTTPFDTSTISHHYTLLTRNISNYEDFWSGIFS